MTEAEWLACHDPRPILEFLKREAGDRKLRLFAVACCRRVVHLIRFKAPRHGLEVAERYADGLATTDQRFEAFRAVGAVKEFGTPLGLAQLWMDRTTRMACLAVYEALMPEERLKFDGAATPPLRSVEAVFARASRAAGGRSSGTIDAAIKASDKERSVQASLARDIFGNPFRTVALNPNWLTSTVAGLAEGIYAERAFDRMPILADALQDAGCDNDDILTHCRGDGPHVRGCWVVDLLLGKS
jgi:hypothetical protein